MFERYTEKARRVVFFSRYEAAQVGSSYIEPEHILLGICREGAEGMPEFRSRYAAIVRQALAERSIAKREPFSTTVDLPLVNESKRILAYAAEEAERLSDRHISSGHLLLGLLRERGTLAYEVLEQNGIALEQVRSELAEKPTPAGRPAYPTQTQFQKLLYNPASESLIVEITRYGRLGAVSRISVRARDAEQYEPIGEPSEDISYQCPVTCEEKPLVLFLESHLTIGGGNFGDVLAYDLKTKVLNVAIATHSILIEGAGRTWIASLHSLSPNGAMLYFTLAVERMIAKQRQVEYSLARMHLADKKLEILTRLQNVFY